MSTVLSYPYPRRRRRPAPGPAELRRRAAGRGSLALRSSDSLAGAGGATHDELVALARSIQAAAVAEDLVELSRSVQLLREGLRRHVEVEREQQDGLTPALRAVVFGGQDRLLRLADAISHSAEPDQGCACLQRATEIVVAIHRQLALEAAALLRPADAR